MNVKYVSAWKLQNDVPRVSRVEVWLDVRNVGCALLLAQPP
jgi:hypothetical protein